MLDIIPGIGEVKKKKLLKHFGSLKKIKESNIDELCKIIDKKTAEKLINYLNKM